MNLINSNLKSQRPKPPVSVIPAHAGIQAIVAKELALLPLPDLYFLPTTLYYSPSTTRLLHPALLLQLKQVGYYLFAGQRDQFFAQLRIYFTQDGFKRTITFFQAGIDLFFPFQPVPYYFLYFYFRFMDSGAVARAEDGRAQLSHVLKRFNIALHVSIRR